MLFFITQNQVFWTDMDHGAVMSANRLTGEDVQMLAVDLDQPEDIILYHDLKQPTGRKTSPPAVFLIRTAVKNVPIP